MSRAGCKTTGADGSFAIRASGSATPPLGSKFLINTLHDHGLCSSYTEVLNFESCAAAQTPTTADIDSDSDSPITVMLGNGHFRQYVCDNADRNPWTIDGKTSLHAMGMIEAITPSIRSKAMIRRDDLKAVRSAIEILHYNIPSKNNPILYHELMPINVENPSSKLDLLWKIARSFKPDAPGWSGVMQAVSDGTHAGKATVRFLPMLDLNPTNMTCIYSTLCFITRECVRHNCTPVITFDQPLWLKARTIVGNEPGDSELKQVILDLGGFHTMMSYLGSIGHFMTNTGLREVLEVIYGENAVTYDLNGKSYARASRGHFLVESVLTRLLIHERYDSPPSSDDDQTVLNPDLQLALELFDQMMDNHIAPSEVLENPVMSRIAEGIAKTKSELAGYATPELWLQYMTTVDILRDFIRAQRTGSWSLHKYCLREMLPYFAAAGHNHYAKSVQIHLQDLEELEAMNPRMYEMFSAGLFVIRRSDRYWAGLSNDLVIEQTLMRTMKVTGGLVHGRGVMSEKQRNKWLLSLPVCATVNESMQELSNRSFSTSEQHKELASARVKRDNKDAMNIFNFLCENNPFERTKDLRSITSGLTADDTVNVHKAKKVGEKIFDKMYGKNAFQFSFSRKDTVVQLGQDKQVRIDGEEVNIDPQLLFNDCLLLVMLTQMNMT